MQDGIDMKLQNMERSVGYRVFRPHEVDPTTGKEPKYALLERIIMQNYATVVNSLQKTDPVAAATRSAWGIKSRKHLEEEISAFRWKIHKSIRLAEQGTTNTMGNSLFYRLRHAFITEGYTGLQTELKYALMGSVIKTDHTAQVSPAQKSLADMRYPMEWYPATRMMHRTIHLHVGPTNSGKTYHALQRLEQAETGIYAGPLRLLAHEVYTRLNAKGIPCALVTGEERRVPEGLEWTMKSCTVEMVPLNDAVDVAVIDEIQMIGDPDRGWAWTQAFLGVRAKEVHLCGEARTVPIIRDICAAIGDKLEVHEYNRLSPLEMDVRSLDGNMENLRKGDAVILFSRIQLHAMKKHIEETTGKRCAIVYGSLPPETRAQQASLFNDPDNDYDFLVASDAVGMGLNLSIKRIIFDTTWKHDGFGQAQLTIPEIKQIAGRAGRYRTARDATVSHPIDLTDGEPPDVQPPLQVREEETVGYVTTLDDQDLSFVSTALETTPSPLEAAYILPPNTIVERFAAYFPPGTPFSYILLRLNEIAIVSKHFKLCRLKDAIEIADHVQHLNLTVSDNLNIAAAPVQLNDIVFSRVLIELAECVAQRQNIHILDLKSMPNELLGMGPHEYPGGREAYLRAMEVFHKAITLYLWLSYRFSSIFRDQAVAFHLKGLTEQKINENLARTDFDYAKRKKMLLVRQLARERQVRKEKLASDPDLVRELNEDEGDIAGADKEPVIDSGDIGAPAVDDSRSSDTR
jgi:ATP-dependent RNA helicase SUPV3L1/SUV3